MHSPKQKKKIFVKKFTCGVCKKVKELKLFTKSRCYEGGRCKACKAESDAKYRRNPKVRASQKLLREDRRTRTDKVQQDALAHRAYTTKNLSAQLIHGTRRRAKVFGLEHSITKEDIPIPEVCPLLGIKLERCSKNNRDTSPSVDRIDSSKGYTKDNVWVISYRANRIKNNATLEELKTIAENWEKYSQTQ